MRHPASDTFVAVRTLRYNSPLALRVVCPDGRLSARSATLRLATLLSACGAREGDTVEVTVRVVDPAGGRPG